MWAEVLKMPMPRTPDPTKEEYEQMDFEKKRIFHVRMKSRAKREGNKKESSFHEKMRRLAAEEKHSYYSIKDAPPSALQHGGRKRIEREKEYEEMSDDEKRKFHGRMSQKYRSDNRLDHANFHQNMMTRLREGRKTHYSLYHAPELPKTTTKWSDMTYEKYKMLNNGEKINYHRHLSFKNKHIKTLRNFHDRMAERLASGGGLPTAFSPRIYDMWYGDIPESEPQEIKDTLMPKEWEKYMKKSWFEILKSGRTRKIKMHLPTLKNKVVEWAEINREGRYKPQDIIDYVKDEVIAASIDDWIKRTNPNPRSFGAASAAFKRRIARGHINFWMPKISPTLKKLGFKMLGANLLEREEGYSGVIYQDENDWKRMSAKIRREKQPQEHRYGGAASRWEEGRE